MKKLITRIGILMGLYFLCGYAQLYAQQATIRGNVYDSQTGSKLAGAQVILFQGVKLVTGTYSDLDGDYTFKTNPGSYQIQVVFSSYITDTVDLEIQAGELKVINHELSSSVLETVIIEAKASSNVTRSIEKKLSEINTIEVIDTELMTNMGANTPADALPLSPGTTITEGKYINVRGLSDRYNRTLINMGEIPPLDPDRETVQLDRFPASLISNIVVYKNFTPDLPGSFSAGLVDLQTKTHPDKFELQLTASLTYNTVSSLRNDFLSHENGNLTWLGLDDGSREWPARGDNEQWTPLYSAERTSSFLNQNYNFSLGDQKSLFGKPFGYGINISYRRTEQDFTDYQIGRHFVQITPQNGIDTLNLSDGTFTNGSGLRMESTTLAGVNANMSYKPGKNHKIQFTYLLNQGGKRDTRELVGTNTEDSQGGTTRLANNTMRYTTQNLNSFQLKGDHGLGIHTVDWVGSASFSSTRQPDARVFAYDVLLDEIRIFTPDTICFDPPECTFVIIDPFGTLDTILVDTTAQRGAFAGTDQQSGRFNRNLTQRTFDLKVNMKTRLPIWEDDDARKWDIKYGGAYTFKNRNFSQVRVNLLDSLGRDQFSWLDSSGGIFSSSVLAWEDAYPNIVYSPFFRQVGIPYYAEQTVIAGYFMTEFTPVEKLDIITGLRYEYTNMLIDGAPIGEISVGSGDNGFSNHDFLPALHFIYKPIERMNLRLGYARTLARPSFRETSLFFNTDFKGDFRTAGSPFTRRSLIDNVDVRWEWSRKKGELISISGYYKEILGPIELVNIGGDLLEFNNLRVGEGVEPILPIIPKNVIDTLVGTNPNGNLVYGELAIAQAFGTEIEFVKDFGFIGRGWEKLRFIGNYSLLRTRVPLDTRSRTILENVFNDLFPEGEIPNYRRLYGQPTYTFNTFLTFTDAEKLGLEVSVGYNYFGDRISAVVAGGINIIEKGRGLLNATVRKSFNNGISIRFRARNLLDPQYKQVYNVIGTQEELVTFEDFRRGRSYSLGVSFNLQ